MSAIIDNTLTEPPQWAAQTVTAGGENSSVLAIFPHIVVAIAACVATGFFFIAPSVSQQLAAVTADDMINTGLLPLVFAGGAAAFAALLLTAFCCLDASQTR